MRPRGSYRFCFALSFERRASRVTKPDAKMSLGTADTSGVDGFVRQLGT